MCAQLNVSFHPTPCGILILGSAEQKLALCDWSSHYELEESNPIDILSCRFKREIIEGTTPIIEEAKKQLDEYFSRDRTTFDLPLLLNGTEFQKEVWETLLMIPYGTTQPYADIAKQMGRPTSVRAIANAIGANILSIIIPCHRVIGSDGSLTGYRGGLPAKRYLLTLEKSL